MGREEKRREGPSRGAVVHGLSGSGHRLSVQSPAGTEATGSTTRSHQGKVPAGEEVSPGNISACIPLRGFNPGGFALSTHVGKSSHRYECSCIVVCEELHLLRKHVTPPWAGTAASFSALLKTRVLCGYGVKLWPSIFKTKHFSFLDHPCQALCWRIFPSEDFCSFFPSSSPHGADTFSTALQ